MKHIIYFAFNNVNEKGNLIQIFKLQNYNIILYKLR